MRIDNISNNNFQGKFIIPKKLTQREQVFANQLVHNYWHGKDNIEYLKDKNFDINIYGASGKRRIPPKLALIINLKYIGTNRNERGVDITNIKKEIVSLDHGMFKPTCDLRNFIDATDSYIENNLPTQYNTKFQKFIVKAKMFLGFV